MKITKVVAKHHILDFKFEAGTSRGKLNAKDTWYLILYEGTRVIGVGEAGPLRGLSIDKIDEMPEAIELIAKKLEGNSIPDTLSDCFLLANEICNKAFPSIRFAVETALLDARNGGLKMIFDAGFFKRQKRIPINGLVWMGEEDFMQQQIKEKLREGFNCIKMKIGAIDFQTELKLLKSIRKNYSKEQITLRVDANGAFSPEEALNKLNELAVLDLHSIEQPIKAGSRREMHELCRNSPLAIALDEELIGLHDPAEKETLLKEINPQYIILKPTLIGGIQATLEWINLCKKHNIGWWLTSMLESNIGLNAICQLADYLKVNMPQGLGTGKLYHNNIESPLTIQNGEIYYNAHKDWQEIELI
ncbi:o-succinylbenzoate synthase [Marivirga lumbricoides]|uniref:O-succinylbenzoate synthase n=1 Tax=Marivirga lumbricoides TaxID=1046115 RepID=A0ABQ1M1G0_9BACT|nr:o-succinylbenzoate synthase [Marivirga lumbricoides]